MSKKTKNDRLKKDSGQDVIKADKASIINIDISELMVFSFSHFCRDQGSSFKQWEKEGVLKNALEKIAAYSKKRISDEDGTYTIYGDFPPKSGFTHPSYIPEDARWARIHVNGKHIIAGHVIKNVFYVVFLDSEHKFWVTRKKHT